MKQTILIGAILIAAGPLLAADANLKETVTNAAKKLAEQSNYSWTSTVESAGGGGRGGFGSGTTEGKTEKGGATVLNMTRGENTTRAVLKGEKGAIRTNDGWLSLSEAAEEQGRGRFTARTLQNFKAPAQEAQELLGKVQDFKEMDGAYTAELTKEGAESLMRFGGRGGGGAEVSGAKGSVKYWVKDGVLTKYQTRVQGTISFNNNDREIDRTTTVEIKEIGSTKVDVPSEAAKKIS